MMTIDLAQAMARLERLALLDMSPWMSMVGEIEKARARQRILELKTDPIPDGAPWSPWQPSTARGREAKGNAEQGLLWDKGTLLASIQSQQSHDELAIGSNIPYAGYLQDGTDRMPARPYLGWDDSDLTEMEFSAVRFIEALL